MSGKRNLLYVISISVLVVYTTAGCATPTPSPQTQELYQLNKKIWEYLGGADRVLCYLHDDASFSCLTVQEFTENYQDIYGTDLAIVAASKIVQYLEESPYNLTELDSDEDLVICHGGIQPVNLGPSWDEPFGVKPEILYDACREGLLEGFLIVDFGLNNVFTSDDYQSAVDEFISQMDEQFDNCDEVGLGSLVSIGGADDVVVEGVWAVLTWFSHRGGGAGFTDGSADAWAGKPADLDKWDSLEYRLGYERVRVICHGGSQGDEGCAAFNELYTPETPGESTPETPGESTPETTEKGTPTPTGEDTPEPTEKGTPTPTGEDTPEPTGEVPDDDDTTPTGCLGIDCGCSSCEEIKIWWSLFKEQCNRSNWQIYECQAFIAGFYGCPDPGVINPGPNGDFVCGTLASQEEMEQRAAIDACEERQKVASIQINESGDRYVTCTGISQSMTAAEYEKFRIQQLCTYMLTDGDICSSVEGLLIEQILDPPKRVFLLK